MILNPSKGNMYEFITHTWNPIKGKCYHDCSYCYMKNMVVYEQPVHLVKSELEGDFGLNKFIFLGSSTDEFAQDVPTEWITKVLDCCYNKTKNQTPQDRTRFLIQTKNPKRLLDFIEHPLFDVKRKQVVACTTLETNRHYAAIMNNAPLPQDRAEAMRIISNKGIGTYVTIEPIMDFDLNEFVSLIKQCNPKQVNIGLNTNKNVKLPAPTVGKAVEFVSKLNEFTKVHIKANAQKLRKALLQANIVLK